MTGPGPTLYSPTRYACLRLRGAWQRMRCGRRFGHFPVPDWAGYLSCARCGCPLL
jgi:hypothetical protein